jgi:hypothetical protein
MEEANDKDILAIQEFHTNIRASLEAGEIREMLRVTMGAVERFPFLKGLAVHVNLMALNFEEAIRLHNEYQGMPHPIVLWAMQKGIPNMADVGEALFAKIRERQAKIENSLFELDGPDSGGDLRDYRLTYTVVLERTEKAVELLKDVDVLRTQFPNWGPDVTVTFTSPELMAFQDTATGTLQ